MPSPKCRGNQQAGGSNPSGPVLKDELIKVYIMDKERAEKSLRKLKAHLKRSTWIITNGYAKVFALAEQYAEDAKHFFKKGDYFSSFGASDYAYGLLDAAWIVEKGKLPPPL